MGRACRDLCRAGRARRGANPRHHAGGRRCVLLVGGGAGADCRGGRAALPRDLDGRGICRVEGALRRGQDPGDYPAVWLLSHGGVSGERARAAAGGKRGAVSAVTVIASEAKQSRAQREALDELAMTEEPYATPARSRSCICKIPTGLFASVTISVVIFTELSSSIASLASELASITLG